MSKKPLSLSAKYGLVSLCAIGLQAQAEVNISGFASMRATSLDSDAGNSPLITLASGGTGDISFKDESRFGLQVSADLGEGLTATAQLLAEGSNDFEVNAQWAYLNYQINDTHQVKVGRLANPFFRQSQYQDVGYAHNYGRLPSVVYGSLPFDTIDGIALDSTFLIGDYTLDTKLFFGNHQQTMTMTMPNGMVVAQEMKLEDEMGFNATLSADWWEVFTGYLVTDSVGSGAEYKFEYSFAGFAIDYNNIIAEYEAVYYNSDDFGPSRNDPNTLVTPGKTNAYYASIGYRFNDVIVTVYRDDIKNEATFRPQEQGGTGIVLRYDFHPSAALKVDYYDGEQVVSPRFGPITNGDYEIMSVGVDLVF